jgi:hypothetical protein
MITGERERTNYLDSALPWMLDSFQRNYSSRRSSSTMRQALGWLQSTALSSTLVTGHRRLRGFGEVREGMEGCGWTRMTRRTSGGIYSPRRGRNRQFTGGDSRDATAMLGFDLGVNLEDYR